MSDHDFTAAFEAEKAREQEALQTKVDEKTEVKIDDGGLVFESKENSCL